MWIAFKNYYLRDEEQHKCSLEFLINSCELLSKIIIFVTRNNHDYEFELVACVVNCFQKLLSSWRGTTFLRGFFATNRCELLSKIIIFVTRNNAAAKKAQQLAVVNCFQKLLSSWRGTTDLISFVIHELLWIAFKNYYLRDEEQQCPSWERESRSCELLSKIIIFVTRNNQ